MAEFKLGRLKFVWKGDWTGGAQYVRDDIVNHGAKSYVCVQGHTANNGDFYIDLSNSYWELMTGGVLYYGLWSPLTQFKEGDLVNFGGKVYIALIGHTSGTTDADFYSALSAGDWALYADGTQFKGDWIPGFNYKIGDNVRFGGRTYIAQTGHTSQSDFYANISDWALYTDGTEWRGQWVDSFEYKVNDVVRNGGGLFICNTPHTSAVNFEDAYWDVYVEGYEWEDSWNATEEYQRGDVVAWGGYTYKAERTNTNVIPTSSLADWVPFLEGLNYREQWDALIEYHTGDAVRFGGNVYKCTVDTAAGESPATAPTSWILFLEGINWRNNWLDATDYAPNDVVRYATSSYICIAGHTSEDGVNDPLSDAVNAYWQSFATGSEVATLTTPGDIIIYSGAGVDRLAIGSEGEVLHVGGGIPNWTSTISVGQVQTTDNVIIDNEGDGGALFVGNHAQDYVLQDADKDITADVVSIVHLNEVVTLEYADGTAIDTITTSITSWRLTITGCTGTLELNGNWCINAYDLVNKTIEFNVPSISGGSGALDLTNATVNLLAPNAFTDSLEIRVGDLDGFIQTSLTNKNNGPSASADLIVYADNGDNDNGWIDMGITSSGFDVTSGYGITDKNDGYIFMSAPRNCAGPGNLVIATSGDGTQNDIVFCTGGFDIVSNTDAEKMRIVGEPRAGVDPGVIIQIDTSSTSPDTGALQVQGGVGVLGSIYLEGEIDAFGGAIYQGRKDNGDGTYSPARDLIQDFDRLELVVDLLAYTTSLTHDGSVVTLTYAAGAGTYPSIQVGGFIEFEEGSFDPTHEVLFSYNEVLTHDTVNRIITFSVPGITGSSPIPIPSDVVAHYYGPNAYVGLTNASGVFTGDADDFVQFALKNHNTGQYASTDIIAYSSDGDNESGWIDMGITSETFGDPAYGVTEANDGYIFMSAPRNTTGHGNLFLSTSENGTQNDIIFSTDGFYSGNERMRIIGTDRPGSDAGVEIYSVTNSTSTTTGALRVQGGIGLQGNLNVGGNVAIVGTITIGGEGSSLETTTLAVSDPMIRMGTGNVGDAIDLGFYGETAPVNTALSADITASDFTITVDSTASFSNSGVITIDSEQIAYTSKDATHFFGCTRGQNGTTADAHLDNTAVRQSLYHGLVRDASDGKFKLFENRSGYSPTQTVDFFALGLATLKLARLETDYIQTAAYVDVGTTLYVDGLTTAAGGLTVTSATSSTSQTTGALRVTGGVGINENLNVGGLVNFANTTAATSYDTGALKVAGGVGIAGDTYIQGVLNVYDDITSWYSSDSRLKDNVTVIDGALNRISQINGYTFDWKPEAKKDEAHDIGVIAQEIQAVLPEVVVERNNGYLAVNYEKIVPLLIQGIKELQSEVENLKAKLNA